MQKISNSINLPKGVTMAAAALHIVMAFVSALSKTPVNEMGFFSVLLGILSLAAVVLSSMARPFLGSLAAVAVILIPGMLVGALTSMVLYGFLAGLVLGPLAYFAYLINYILANYSFIIIYL